MIAPEASAAFVANMEDVLEVYQRPVDPKRPLVCLDETSKQLIKETRTPIAVKPGQPVRQDYEYVCWDSGIERSRYRGGFWSERVSAEGSESPPA